ncbi:hypothetical protein ES703_78349 [subsurface metagenome]
MSFMDKWYVGHKDNGASEVFTSDDPKRATAEASGYDSVDGPFDEEEAESLID